MMFAWLQRLFSGSAPEPVRFSAPESERSAPPEVTPQPAVACAPAGPDPAAVPGPAPVSFEQFDRVNRAWEGWLFARSGEDTGLEMTPTEARVLDALEGINTSQQSGVALVRRMPGLIPQLLQSLRSDGFSGAALSRTISSDVVLVAEVIRLANSCYIGTGTTITSVEHAVILIGQEGLRQLITSVAFRPIIDMHSGHYTRTLARRLWAHAERCAVANRVLAEQSGIEPFDAFLAGLVQSVGLIVALRIMDQVAKGEHDMGSELFCARLAGAARSLSCSIAREWDFPPAVIQALQEQGGPRKGAQMSALGRLAMLTDYLARLQALSRLGLLAGLDQSLLAGLPPAATHCYQLLAAAPEERAA